MHNQWCNVLSIPILCWFITDIETNLTNQQSDMICFRLLCIIEFSLTVIIVHRNNQQIRAVKMQCLGDD